MNDNKTNRIYLGNFCGETPFWDNDLSWNTEYPDLTFCFLDTVPSWIPFLYIVFAYLCHPRLFISFMFKAKQEKDSQWEMFMKYANIVLSLAFSANVLIRLFCFLMGMSEIVIETSAQFFSLTILVNSIATMFSVFLALLLVYGKYCDLGYESSSISLIFWTLVFLLQFLPLQHFVRSQQYETNGLHNLFLISSIITVIISLALCIFGCIQNWGLSGSNYDRASIFSRWTFTWITPTLWKGVRKTLSVNALDMFPKEFQSATLLERYIEKVKSGVSIKLSSFILTLMSCYKMQFFALLLLRIIFTPIRLLKPICLSWLINHVLNRDKVIFEYEWKGFFYAFFLFFIAIVGAFIHWNFWWYMNLLAIKIQNTAMILIFNKSLRLTSHERLSTTTGEIVNLMSVDARRFFFGLEQLIAGLVYPLELLGLIWLLYNQIGISVFAGFGVLIFCFPTSCLVGTIIMKCQKKNMEFKDARVKLLNEMLSGIKTVKYYAWEGLFLRKVFELRKRELAMLKSMLYWKAVLELNFRVAPILVNVVAFMTFILSSQSNIMTPEKAFVSLALFNMTRIILWGIPDAIYHNIQMLVSSQRIDNFINSTEIDSKCRDQSVVDGETIRVENASFSWNFDSKISLHNLTFNLNKGEILAIVGSVGSGKSTLLHALLGELKRVSGKLGVTKNVAYVSQQPWIQNCSVRDNILFGKQMKPEKYNEILKACDLIHDLKMFPNYDYTEIGDRGINLSGGQKLRISLARAIYSDADLYLLDDPLSAVDSHVGTHIYENVLSSNGLLGKKSRILVTNNLSILSARSSLIHLEKGKIIYYGSIAEWQKQNPNFVETEALREIFKKDKKATEELAHSKSGKLIVSEDTMRDKISKEVFVSYFQKFGYYVFFGFMFAFVAAQFFDSYSSIKLSEWVDDLVNENITNTSSLKESYAKRKQNLSIYCVLRLSSPLFLSSAMLFQTIGSINAARRFHADLTKRVIAFPMYFYDTVPLGRIMNRFSSDIDVIDTKLPEKLFLVVETLMITIFALLLIAWVKPWFLVVIPFIIITCYPLKFFYVEGTRKLQRLEFISRTPIFSMFHEALQGIPVIRAFTAEARFKKESMRRIDKNMQAAFLLWGANRWIAFNLEIFGCFILLLCSLYAIMHESTGGEAGLIISMAINISGIFGDSFREISHVENLFISVERIKEYCNLPSEDLWRKTDGKSLWPWEGKLKFQNYSTRYRENLALALKRLNFYINGGQRVGIVGRTGAGKTSLTLALFRMLEASEGWIEIDGVKTKDISLYKLRSNISIIPQDPFIFSGTLRLNLDPFDQQSDIKLWHVLKLVQLENFTTDCGGLNMQCMESGENLSLGQRQLVCLARALLRDSKILVLDEATAGVDLETDALIQKTIRKEFVGRTIITIAHRIDTIMDYDRVIVLDEGQVLEIGNPEKLAKDQSSAFYKIIKNSRLI